MRYGLPIFGVSAVLLVLGCGALIPDLLAQGIQRSTKSTSASETNSLEIFKSLNGLDAKGDGMKQLDDELNKTLQPFTAQRSVEGHLPWLQGPRVPVTKSRLSKEDLLRSKGWIWDTEEAVSGKSGDDAGLFPGFKSSSGSDKKRSSWDQLSNQTRPERLDSSASRARKESKNSSNSNSDDDVGMSGSIGEAAKTLNRTLKSRFESESVGSIFNTHSSRSSALDFLGQATDSRPSSAQVQAHKAYMDQYQKIIGAPIESSFNVDFLKSVATPSVPGQSQGLDSLPGSSRKDGLAFTPGSGPSVLTPATLPDANQTILHGWDPLYIAPKTELPKPAPFFSPPVEIPRRKF